jgi:GNAT superfamily N-acetyltransferase
MNDVAAITVRAAAASDADRLATLLTDEGYPAGSSDMAARIERFSTTGSRVLVAEAADTVIGFVAFHVIPRFETDERFIRVIALVIDPGERERGVARLLLADVERIAIDEGISFLEVTAGRHRPEARQLFESLGYESGVTSYLRKRP